MTYPQVREFLVQVLTRVGMYAYEAEVVADRLLDADLLGRSQSGCASLPGFLECMDMGDIDPRAIALQRSESPATAFLDANEGMGHVVGTKGMEMAIAKAREVGIGLVVVANSQQLGSPLVYARLAAAQGMIGICLTSTAEKIAAPTSAEQCLFLGSQPLAYAIPFESTVLGYDFSFRPEDETLVTFPLELSAPLGLLHAVLTCGLSGERMPSQKTRGPHLERTEHVLAAFNPECFAGLDKFRQRTHSLAEYFKQQSLPLEEFQLTIDPQAPLPSIVLEALPIIAERAKVSLPKL